jgi:hypothetical protein
VGAESHGASEKVAAVVWAFRRARPGRMVIKLTQEKKVLFGEAIVALPVRRTLTNRPEIPVMSIRVADSDALEE